PNHPSNRATNNSLKRFSHESCALSIRGAITRRPVLFRSPCLLTNLAPAALLAVAAERCMRSVLSPHPLLMNLAPAVLLAIGGGGPWL
ncbi:MAG: hypothetical protein AAFO78_14700, partial [Pseudomonadota bacterium]